jgi:hypothetical protein
LGLARDESREDAIDVLEYDVDFGNDSVNHNKNVDIVF